MKKIAIIGSAGIPAKYGGFETLAQHLVKELKDDFRFQVYCSEKFYGKEERMDSYHNAELIYLPLKANGIQSIPYDIISMVHAAFTCDILLLLGVSGGLFCPILRLFTNKKIIVNIDGLEWRRSKWNKFAKFFLRISEKIAVKYSHADITDNAALKRYALRQYKTISHLISYGADHVEQISPTEADIDSFPFLKSEYAFKVARIEPENNIELILKAFDKLNKNLVLVGNWQNSEYGRDLYDRYVIPSKSNIHLLHPIYEQNTLDIIRSNAYVYIHGHSAGGTNPSLVEAMFLSLPILSFDVSFNRETTNNQAIYFKTAEDLKTLINTKSKQDLVQMGNRLKTIANDKYTWSIIAAKYRRLFYSFEFNYRKQYINQKWSKFYEKGIFNGNITAFSNEWPYRKIDDI